MAHELGHFMAARSSGVRVNEFWIGMGPAILRHRIGETEFKLCILPFGGACVMEGEDEDTEDPRCFTKASAGRRILILAAGALMNFLVGFLIVFVLCIPAKQTVVPVIFTGDGLSIRRRGWPDGGRPPASHRRLPNFGYE